MILRIPTQLNDKEIEAFRTIYKSTFGKRISKDEAMRQGLKLIRFIAHIIDNNEK